MQGYDDVRFNYQVNQAVSQIRTILHQLRAPTFPADVAHKYDDKYLMVDFLTNTALASQINCFELFGLDLKTLVTIKEWSKNRSVTITLRAVESCAFDRKEKRKIEGPTTVIETKGILGTGTKKEKVVTKVTDYFYKYSVSWELFVYKGSDPNEKISLQSRKGTYEIMTNSDTLPKPSTSIPSNLDLDITWLLSQLSDESMLNFHIDRSNPKRCKTPRRNPEVEAALSYMRSFYYWAGSVHAYWSGHVFPVQTAPKLDVSKIDATNLFVPVVPLFEDPAPYLSLENAPVCRTEFLVYYDPSLSSDDSVALPTSDLNLFLQEEQRSLKERISEFSIMFPEDGKLVTEKEARIMLIMLHLRRACQHFSDGIEYVEVMLRNQLIAAIGKVVTTTDFTNYMEFHHKKIFKPEYQPQPFSYAIRQPDRFPEGTIGIDVHLDDGSVAAPIRTIVRHTMALRPMRFNVTAATEISFHGHRYLHGYIEHQFSGHAGTSLSLVARARQWSSFIVMIGSISGADLFDPKHAIVVQNKDDLVIPLLKETIPTPKQFRDAIESLSPEQQRFAKAFRSMQLSSSIFAVVVLQVRPQLEKLMKLPPDSLTKELKLSNHLLELLTKYQIPSDLLSFGGKPHLTTAQKVSSVRRNAESIQGMIDDIRQKELDEAKAAREHQKNLDREERERIREVKEIEAYNMVLDTDDFCFSPVLNACSMSLGASLPGLTGMVLDSAPIPAPPVLEALVQQEPPEPPKEQPKEEQHHAEEKKDKIALNFTDEDFSAIPKILDKKFEELDLDNAVRATILKPQKKWQRKTLPSLLASPIDETLGKKKQETEKKKALDLVDALSRSGGLDWDEAELHVVLASTHCFDRTLMDTVIQENVNPVEKLERSSLIMATTVHQVSAQELVKDEHRMSVSAYSGNVFKASSLH